MSDTPTPEQLLAALQAKAALKEKRRAAVAAANATLTGKTIIESAPPTPGPATIPIDDIVSPQQKALPEQGSDFFTLALQNLAGRPVQSGPGSLKSMLANATPAARREAINFARGLYKEGGRRASSVIAVELEVLKARLTLQETLLDAAKSSLADAQAAHLEKQGALEQELHTLTAMGSHDKERATALEERLASAQREFGDREQKLQHEVAAIEAAFKTKQGELETLLRGKEEQLRLLRDKLDAAEQGGAEHASAVQKLRTEVERLRRQTQGDADLIHQLRISAQGSKQIHEDLTASLVRAQGREAELAALRQEIERRTAMDMDAAEARGRLDAQLKGMREQNEDLEKRIKEARAETSKLVEKAKRGVEERDERIQQWGEVAEHLSQLADYLRKDGMLGNPEAVAPLVSLLLKGFQNITIVLLKPNDVYTLPDPKPIAATLANQLTQLDIAYRRSLGEDVPEPSLTQPELDLSPAPTAEPEPLTSSPDTPVTTDSAPAPVDSTPEPDVTSDQPAIGDGMNTNTKDTPPETNPHPQTRFGKFLSAFKDQKDK